MAEGNGASAPNAAPQINTLTQYTKDFSFENPNAPRSLGPQERQPNISVQVNVNANQLSDTDYEVLLKLEGAAGEGANTLFRFDLEYGGVFKMLNIPQDQLHPVVMIECPRILFPFARQIVAEAVRNGGFPPLYLDPIDFAALYMQRVSEMQGEQPPVA
ncbi:MAG: protein-export chaperone SecB [Hyphomicrobiales bacterium]|nr:protein-export chaperone SecB [Hyphomicrobiales bacterium]